MIFKLIILFALIVTMSIFSSIETALLTISKTVLLNMKTKYPQKKKYLHYWEENPEYVITGILVGTNLICIAAGVISMSLGMDLTKFGNKDSELFLWLIPLGITISILLFGEILPKIYGRCNYEKVCFSSLPGIVTFVKTIEPVVQKLVNFARRLIELLGGKTTDEMPFINPRELKLLLQSSGGTILTKEQQKILRNIIDFTQFNVSQVMIPLDKIFAIDISVSMKDLFDLVRQKRYSRIPVFQHSLNNIVGVIYTKDLLVCHYDTNLFLIEDLLRQPYFISQKAKVYDLLYEFKKGHYHMAIVVDDKGSTVGLVTIEDLVEEIVGEIYDEYDREAH